MTNRSLLAAVGLSAALAGTAAVAQPTASMPTGSMPTASMPTTSMPTTMTTLTPTTQTAVMNPLSPTVYTASLPAEPAARPAAAAATPAREEAAEPKRDVMPSLHDSQTYMQAIWTVLIFILLLAVLYPTAWKNILAGLKRREEKIRGDIAGAEAARLKAEGSLKDYNAQLLTAEARVRELLAKAQVDGERMATTIRMQAAQEAEETKERAIKEIEAARDAALAEVYQQAANLATTVAEKILRRSINADDQKDLVNQSLEQLATMETAAEPRKVIHI